MTERLTFPRAELRRRTLKGTVITAGFLILIDGLVLIQGLIVTRLLGPKQIGLYGVVSTTVISLVALKRVGIDEAFVQQDEADQEREFQYAFTLELGLSLAMSLVILALSPLVATIYRDHRLLALMASLAYLPLAFALLSPLWVFLRRMDYRRQRSLQAIQPIVAFVVTVPLAAATNLNVWSLVIGQVAGYVAAISAAIRVSPYRLKLRYDHATTKRYLRFSAPILVTVLAAMVLAGGPILIIKLHDGLAAAGFITLAVTLTRYIDRADQIVTATIYPAICAIQGQTRALEEMYEKSNRATLLWVAPYAAGIVLFAPDLVHFILGPSWRPAITLLQGLAIVGAITQLGFNWFTFFRAHGDTRPPAVEALAAGVAFLALCPAGLLLDGFHGFIYARIAVAVVALAVRATYTRRLLPDTRYRSFTLPVLLPLGAASVAVVVLRVALWGGHRPLGQAIGEVVLFVAVYGLAAMRRERALIGELLGAVRTERAAA
jgi:O-antigen/teichoic acid export membrane protein